MNRKLHKNHRSPAWKRDVLLLTSILRLRVSPRLPYTLIAEIALEHFHDPLLRHYINLAVESSSDRTETICFQGPIGKLPQPRERYIDENSFRAWLVDWLEEKYTHAETWLGECYGQAIGKDVSFVEDILDVCELYERGFQARDEDEWRGQVKWQREGDWRFRSAPLGNGECRDWGYIGEQAVKHRMDRERKILESVRAAEEEFAERQRRARVNEELLDRLRNIEAAVATAWVSLPIFAPQPRVLVQLERLLPRETLARGSSTEKPDCGTPGPRIPLFQPVNWTSTHSPEPTSASLKGIESTRTFFDPFTGQMLTTNSPSPKMVELKYHSASPLDPKKASLAVRLHTRWQGFSQQIGEIKAMEEMLKNQLGRGGEGKEGGSGQDAIYMTFD